MTEVLDSSVAAATGAGVPAPDRDDPRHAAAPWLPREFAALDTPMAPVPAGGPGKLGLLELTFAAQDGTTRLVDHYQRNPLQILRPIHVDPARPDMAFVYLLQNGGGMLQGDRYRIDLRCGPGAAAHLTTQSAGKVYRCEQNFVTQATRVVAEAGSLVEVLPDVTIPYRDSRAYLHTDVRMDPTATAILGDVITPGRVAHGERHAYDRFVARTDVHDLAGTLLLTDTVRLAPGDGDLNGPALLGPHEVVGVLHVLSRALPSAELTARLRAALAGDTTAATVLSGVSELPNGCGVTVRLLGPTGAAVERARTVAWDAARRALLGVPAPSLRKA